MAGASRARIGIRGRLLVFLGAAIVAIVALEISAQRVSYSITEEYETLMDTYHLVHRMRVALSGFRSDSDRYIRDPSTTTVERLYEGIASLSANEAAVSALRNLSQEATFEVQATGYGMDAYLPLVSRSISLRAAGRSDFYADFAKAERIAGYVDTYLSKLLSILMREGDLRFKASLERSEFYNRSILIGMIVAGLALIGYTFLVASSITKPIRELAKATERLAKGDMLVSPIKTRSRDEVSVLVSGFYAMSANIRSYIESLKEKAELEKRLHDEEMSLLSMGKALREAQLMNLQDQMRPHFLFNALNSIARSALLEKAPKTETLTISLAKLLRSTMKEGSPYTSLGEEIDIVREYLNFQQVRFGDRLDWSLKFDPALKDFQVPRFLLQPLVENAVRHGIEPKIEKTRILVSVQRRGQRLKAFVVDTGVGMSARDLVRLRRVVAAATMDRLPAARTVVRQENQGEPLGRNEEEAPFPADAPNALAGSGIGLANLSIRLRILYGESDCLQLFSKPGKGTIVRLSIPLKGAQRWPES
ncbi:MAG: histidine kinase [Spirochaetia bacterium]|jgi:sensor histidine kinase YesM|uniref:HAMP domain-containing protein n=1 Tax=bioreactor metagenome TaxID=1076179 RepID=A0A644TXC4_9ZZZZ|nr:histidine kinase [Spirochaetia bacterium]MDD3820188.1 histidine kinase [Spirochaetales bacterium]NLX44484.1 histidine kinase [Treponema sp.]VBB40203.1 putative Integral membrane sensor signal transduction histidine kinase [uncultured Spirochaetota bacterium]MCE1209808.1 histidine kinase [Spirochaetia bacterium]